MDQKGIGFRRIGAVAACLLVTGAPCAAQPAPSAGASAAADRLADCRRLSDDKPRLECFDREITAFISARDRRDLVVVDRQEIQKARRSLFGFSLPDIKLFGSNRNGKDGSEIEELSGTIAAVKAVGYDTWQWELADRSIWQTVEAQKRAGYVKRGDAIVIRPALLGAYRAKVRGDTVGVKRVR